MENCFNDRPSRGCCHQGARSRRNVDLVLSAGCAGHGQDHGTATPAKELARPPGCRHSYQRCAVHCSQALRVFKDRFGVAWVLVVLSPLAQAISSGRNIGCRPRRGAAEPTTRFSSKLPTPDSRRSPMAKSCSNESNPGGRDASREPPGKPETLSKVGRRLQVNLARPVAEGSRAPHSDSRLKRPRNGRSMCDARS
jgi:hypothetical protein